MLGGQRGEVDPVAPHGAVGPDLEAPRAEGEIGARWLAPGDERPDPALGDGATAPQQPPDHGGGTCPGSSSTWGRASVPCSSLSTRYGRTNARGWRR